MTRFAKIERHPFRVQWILDSDFKYDIEHWSADLADVSTIPMTLSTIGLNALEIGLYSLLSREDSTRPFIDQLFFFHLSSTWHWKAMFDDGPHLIHLPGREPFQTGRVKPNVSVSFSSWIDGISIAMILRDINAVRVYAEADPEWIIKYTQLGEEPWEVPFINFLNGIWAYDTNLPSYLTQALEGVDPKYYDESRADFLLHVISPLLELWATVFSSDQSLFNQTLYEQQTTRRDWHASLTEDDGNSIMEYIDLAALAAVCYAHDKGMKIEVQSEYLPEFLIRGQFPIVRWPDPTWNEDEFLFD